MTTAFFAYVNWRGETRLVKVAQCPDKEAVRVLLEGLLDTAVTAR